MVSEIRQFFRDHGIQEVEAIIPDMAGIARGKIMPAEKFAEDGGMRLPESVFLQTVTGDYPAETGDAMSPAGCCARSPRAIGCASTRSTARASSCSEASSPWRRARRME